MNIVLELVTETTISGVAIQISQTTAHVRDQEEKAGEPKCTLPHRNTLLLHPLQPPKHRPLTGLTAAGAKALVNYCRCLLRRPLSRGLL